MKRLLACFAGGLLTASLVAAPSLEAGDNGYQNGRYNGTSAVNGHRVDGNGVHAVGNGYYVNVNGQRVAWPAGGVLVAEPGGMFVSQNGRIYYVQDNPRYDLSGAGKTLILLEDGAAMKTESGNALAQAGGAPKEVVTVPAQYRQHWLAVAAGDRPVRNMTSVPVAPQNPEVTFVPVYFARDGASYGRRNGNGHAAYANGKKKSAHGAYKRTSAKRKTNGSSKSSATVASNGTRNGSRSGYQNGYRNGSRSGYQNGYRTNGATYTAATSNRTVVGETYARVPEEITRNLYQVESAWYQREGDTWSRSDSWRGPFVTVSKSTVPREVKLAAEEPFQD